MKRLIVFAIILALLGLPVPARTQVSMVTTTPGLAALAREVAGPDAKIESLAGPERGPHFVDGKPGYMVKLQCADLLVLVGAGLEAGWLPPLIVGARNPDIHDGRPGYPDASHYAGNLLEVPAQLDRAMGDVHPEGNSHFLHDPRRGLRIAAAIAERLGTLDPKHADSYQRRYAAFEEQLAARIAQWEQQMAEHRGKPIVGYHKSLAYLNEWLGLEALGYVEPLPGISPSASHLSNLILQMKSAQAHVLVAEPWYLNKSARIGAVHKAILTASCGIEPARIVDYKPLLDGAVELAEHKHEICVVLQREQNPCELKEGQDLDWNELYEKATPAECVSVEATDPLYILYTSGTTGVPKGVVRDNGGHAVAMQWSLEKAYGMKPGERCVTDEELDFYTKAFEKSGFTGGINWYRNMNRNWELMENVPRKVEAPSLMVTAGNDVALPPSLAKGMERYVPDLETRLIEDCGHWTQNEQPERLNEILTTWLKKRFG